MFLLSNLELLLALTATCVAAQLPPTVTLQPGTVNGAKCTNTNVNSFFAIPYAKPPTGDLRFAAPVEFSGSYSGGSLNATSKAPACIQFGTEFVEPGQWSEDCLFLDIWVPANATAGSSLPVKFWIYGGSDTGGSISDPLYDGCPLATDTVVVSAAYRLGPLGFLAVESAGISGNFGLQDLELALRWVKRHIAAFGGDPNKVVVFGQSAGAALTWILSSLPQAPTLMNAAIAESGSGRNLLTNDEYQRFGKEYAKTLGCNVTDIACFRSQSTTALNTSIPTTTGVVIGSVDHFTPFLDGKIVPVDPVKTGSRVPLIAGSNTREGTLFVIADGLGPTVATPADYTSFLQQNFGTFAPAIQKYYPISLFNSTPFPAFFAISTVYTISEYLCSTRRAVNATIKAGVPAYTYLFSHTPSCGWEQGIDSARALALLGPTHSAEIPFVFNHLTNLPPPNGTCSFNPQEVAISNALVSAWTSMAASRNPGAAVGIADGPWPQWDASTSRGLLIGNLTEVGFINYTQCELWDKVNEEVVAMQAKGDGTASALSSVSGTASGTSSGSSASSTSDGVAFQVGFLTIFMATVGAIFMV